jgi:hypothetical protein
MVRRIGLGLLLSVFVGFANSTSVNVPQNWIDAYRQGQEDEYYRISQTIKNGIKLIKGMITYKELLIAGKVPPPVVVQTYKTIQEGGTIRVKKSVDIYFPKPTDLSQLKKIAVDIENAKFVPVGGYYAYIDIRNLPDYAVGYLQYQIKRLGYVPYRWGDYLLVGIFPDETTAQSIAKMLTEKLKREGVLKSGEFKAIYVIRED